MKYIDPIYISLGENCLADILIRRMGKRAIISPFSSCDSNIDYIISLEESNYEGFLKRLITGDDGVVKNIEMSCDDIYFERNSNGFRFAHHNPITNSNHLNSIERSQKVFLYHHRINDKTNVAKLAEKLFKFSKFYKQSTCALFYQKQINSIEDRGLILNIINGVLVFEFNTEKIWNGSDFNIFGAKCDEDLIKEMFLRLKIFFLGFET